MKKWLFNPFIYLSDTKALLIGLVVMTATAVIGYYSHTHFDGAIDMHTGQVSPLSIHFIEQLVNLVCVVVIFFIAGKAFSTSSIRFIDVAGTMALARWPCIFSAIVGFGINVANTTSLETLLQGITFATIIFALLSVVFTIWMIALFYNAFTISCNIKGDKAVGIFIAGLLLAEILSKIILNQVDKFTN